jgi:hypothetical protein
LTEGCVHDILYQQFYKEVRLLKTRAFVGPMNNGYARLLIGEKEEERMDVKVDLLTQCLQEPVEEQDILEITLSPEREVIAARKLPEESERCRQEAEDLLNWLKYRK